MLQLQKIFFNRDRFDSGARRKRLAGDARIALGAIAGAAERNAVGDDSVGAVERGPMVTLKDASIARSASGASVAIARLDSVRLRGGEEAGGGVGVDLCHGGLLCYPRYKACQCV